MTSALDEIAAALQEGDVTAVRDQLDALAGSTDDALTALRALLAGASAARLLGDLDGALIRAEAAVRRAPDERWRARAQVAVGDALARLDRVPEARASYEAAAPHGPGAAGRLALLDEGRAGAERIASRLERLADDLRPAQAEAVSDALADLWPAFSLLASSDQGPLGPGVAALARAADALRRGRNPRALREAAAARRTALHDDDPALYVAAAHLECEAADRAGDRDRAYESLAVGWASLAAWVDDAWAERLFSPGMQALVDRWGGLEYTQLRESYARRRALAERPPAAGGTSAQEAPQDAAEPAAATASPPRPPRST